MLLDDLVTAIQTVQARIREHGNSLSQNEYRTRLSLIDPILNALGWDVSDPSLVTVEDHHSGVGTPDYALLGGDSRPKAYIEAKKLGEMAGTTKPSHRSQLLGYADRFQTNYAGLTDGDHWIFRDFSGGLGDGSYTIDITLSNQSAYRSALKLLALWRPNLGTGQPIDANEPILINFPEPDLIIDPLPPPSEFVTLNDFGVKLGKPSRIRMPDGREMDISYWVDILVETAKWLIGSDKLTAAICPIGSIINTTPQSERGNDFQQPSKLPNELFLNKHGSAKTVLGKTRFLLRRCGLDPSSILLKSS